MEAERGLPAEAARQLRGANLGGMTPGMAQVEEGDIEKRKEGHACRGVARRLRPGAFFGAKSEEQKRAANATHDKEIRPGCGFSSHEGRLTSRFFLKFFYVCCPGVVQTGPPPALAFSLPVGRGVSAGQLTSAQLPL